MGRPKLTDEDRKLQGSRKYRPDRGAKAAIEAPVRAVGALDSLPPHSGADPLSETAEDAYREAGEELLRRGQLTPAVLPTLTRYARHIGNAEAATQSVLTSPTVAGSRGPRMNPLGGVAERESANAARLFRLLGLHKPAEPAETGDPELEFTYYPDTPAHLRSNDPNIQLEAILEGWVVARDS